MCVCVRVPAFQDLLPFSIVILLSETTPNGHMFVIMVVLSEDDVYGLSSAWRSSGRLPHSSTK